MLTTLGLAAAVLGGIAWLCHRLDCTNAARTELHRLRAFHGR